MTAIVDLAGRRFGRLTVVRRAANFDRVYWSCVCECGAATDVDASHLVSGRTRSCGCLLAEARRVARVTHGRAASRIYRIWHDMHRRCEDPSRADFEHYGGRGIAVCDRWRSFDLFYRDMGDPPSGATLDRKDNDGPYSPDNCRWSSIKVQRNNTRRNHFLNVGGEKMTIAEAADRFAADRSVIHSRIVKGWPDELAVFGPSLARGSPAWRALHGMRR